MFELNGMAQSISCRTLDTLQVLHYPFTLASLRGSCKRASSSNSLYK
jgi:hypothetical protein